MSNDDTKGIEPMGGAGARALELDVDAGDNESEPAPLPEGVTAEAMPLRWSRRRHLLAAALAAAQGEIVLAEKDRTNEHLSSSYASFGAVREVGRIPLSKHAIALVQGPLIREKQVTVLTELVHASGQWVSCSITFTADYMKGLNWMQVIGVIISYAKRYTLQALTGVAVREDEHDDDGQGLDARDEPQERRPPAPKIDMPTSYEGLLKAIDALASIEEARELWRMGPYMKFEMDKAQQAEAKRKHEAKVEHLRNGTATPAPSKPAKVADDISKRKKSGANATTSNVLCKECNSEISLNGFVVDKGAVELPDGSGMLCSTCDAKASGS